MKSIDKVAKFVKQMDVCKSSSLDSVIIPTKKKVNLTNLNTERLIF